MALQIESIIFDLLDSDPGTPVEGQIWFNTAQKVLKTYVSGAVQTTSAKNNFSAITNPTNTDDSSGGYSVGSRWINTSTQEEYVCIDSSISSAIWKSTTSASGPNGSEISGAITGALVPYALSADVSASFTTPAQVTGALSLYTTLSGLSASYGNRTEVSGAITGALTPYATLAGVSSSFSTPVQVSGAVTAALTPYATLSGVSASFTTPTQVTSALSTYVTLVNLSASYGTRAETSGAITGALTNYATLASISASFTTPAQVSGAITNSLTPYATLAGVSGTFATLSGVSASFATPSQVSSSVTSALTNYSTKTEVSGVLTSSVAILARTNIFTTSQTISGNLSVTGTISASNYLGLPAGAPHDAVTLGTANGLSLSGQELSLAAASTASAGAVTTDPQEFAGAKTFSAITASNIAVTSTISASSYLGLPNTGGGPTIYANAPDSSTSVASITNVNLFSQSVTGIADGDAIKVEADFTIINNSGQARTYTINFQVGGATLIAVIDSTTVAANATNRATFRVSAYLSVASTTSANGTLFFIRAVPAASNTASTGAAAGRFAWVDTSTNYTGTVTIGIGVLSSAATTTQTAILNNWQITKISKNP
jgi:hypothetical protein